MSLRQATAGTGHTPVTAAQRWVLALASAASFLVILDALVVATALTAIRRHLGASLAGLEWTVNAYTLSFAVLLMTAAALGDRLGRRRVFAAGLAVFALASAACALAPDTAALIAARAVQGTGAAAIMPMALALLNGAFPPERRGWAIGIDGSVTGLAAVAGPVLGGAVTQGLGWPWVFWINVPVALAAIPLVLGRLPDAHGPRGTVDLPGLVLVTAETIGTLAAGAAAAAGFARRLAEDGAAVALTYATAAGRAAEAASHIEDKGGRAVVIHADPAAAARAVKQTVDQLGRLDILVNNAGIFAGGPQETSSALSPLSGTTAGPKTSPPWPPTWPATAAGTSPAPRSPSTAASPREPRPPLAGGRAGRV